VPTPSAEATKTGCLYFDIQGEESAEAADAAQHLGALVLATAFLIRSTTSSPAAIETPALGVGHATAGQIQQSTHQRPPDLPSATGFGAG
jgi:hypothetical protein